MVLAVAIQMLFVLVFLNWLFNWIDLERIFKGNSGGVSD